MFTVEVNTKTGPEDVDVYTVEDARFPVLTWRKVKHRRKFIEYAEQFATLDTETSHIEDRAGWIYQWAVKLGKYVYVGRRPSEIIALIEKLVEVYGLTDERKIIFYVHNLSYDFQYLKHYLKEYDVNLRVMATDAHKLISADVRGIKFVCSYRLTNLSLNTFAKQYAQKYLKAAGAIDYGVIRYQDTELTKTDWFYMVSDVFSQWDAISNYLKINGFDYAADAPLTSTGFVRTDCRHASERSLNWRKKFMNSQLSLEQYNLMRASFMGGITIASWKYAGKTVRAGDPGVPGLKHYDFTSSYPARQMMDYFPTGRPAWYGEVNSTKEFKELLENYCCTFIITLYNVHIKPGITAPYIPSSKCMDYSGILKINGKVVFAEKLSICINEIDFKWIHKQYTFDDYSVSKMLIFKRGKIPAWLREQIMKYYRNKSTLKKADPNLYMASKAKLNGIYGMSATAIVRDQFYINSDCVIESAEGDAGLQISNFYNSRNSFMPYQYGTYTTAWARDALMQMVEIVGYNNFLYCDTDSVFYISDPETDKRMDEFNAALRDRAITAGAYIDENNILGVATEEPAFKSFRALHAKCYALEEKNASGDYELKVTIAGIPKSAEKWTDGKRQTITNAEELGCIDNLKNGFIFTDCGGVRAVYIEQEEIIETEINGHKTELSSSAIILPIEKEIQGDISKVADGIMYHILIDR